MLAIEKCITVSDDQHPISQSLGSILGSGSSGQPMLTVGATGGGWGSQESKRQMWGWAGLPGSRSSLVQAASHTGGRNRQMAALPASRNASIHKPSIALL